MYHYWLPAESRKKLQIYIVEIVIIIMNHFFKTFTVCSEHCANIACNQQNSSCSPCLNGYLGHDCRTREFKHIHYMATFHSV